MKSEMKPEVKPEVKPEICVRDAGLMATLEFYHKLEPIGEETKLENGRQVRYVFYENDPAALRTVHDWKRDTLLLDVCPKGLIRKYHEIVRDIRSGADRVNGPFSARR